MPEGPANVAVRILPTEVFFTWDPVPGAEYYQLFRRQSDQTWVSLMPATTPSHHDDGFVDLPTHYQIAAFNSTGQIAATLPLLVTNALSNVSIIHHVVRPLSDSSVVIGWAVSGEADGVLEVGTADNVPFFVAVQPSLKTVHEFLVTDLVPGTTYWYRLISTGANRGAMIYRNSFRKDVFVSPELKEVDLTLFKPRVECTDNEIAPLHFFAHLLSGSATTFTITVPPTNGIIFGSGSDVIYNPRTTATSRGSGDRFKVQYANEVESREAEVTILIYASSSGPHDPDLAVTLPEDSVAEFWLGRIENVVSLTAQPTNGVVLPNTSEPGPGPTSPLRVRYAPVTNFAGVDHLHYQSRSPFGTGNVAKVRLRIQPVPDAPVAYSQFITATQELAISITAAVNDPDSGDLLSVAVSSSPSHGTVSVSGERTLTYQPAFGYFGPDSLVYRYSDGLFSGYETININVLHVNHPPISQPLFTTTEFEIPIDVTLVGSDRDGDPLTFQMMTSPTSGNVTGTPPQLRYIPNTGFSGLDSLVYRANDGELDSPPAIVSFTVLPPAPPASPTSLAALVISRTQINLGWTDNSRDEDGFEIERANDNKPWKLIATVARDTRTFADTGLMKNKTYSYRVRAVNRFGASSFTAPVSNTTPR